MEVSSGSPDNSSPASETTSSAEVNLLRIAKGVEESLRTLPPNIPDYGESNEFWDTVSILKQPDVNYGEVRVVPNATDEYGTRRSFVRPILDQNGKQIGEWEKYGFISNKGSEPRLTYFSETVSPAAGQSEMVRVGIDENGRMTYVRKIDIKDYKTISEQELSYRYNQAGEVISIDLKEQDPDGNINKKQVFLNHKASTTPSTEPLQTTPPQVSSEAVQTRGGIFSRLFRRR